MRPRVAAGSTLLGIAAIACGARKPAARPPAPAAPRIAGVVVDAVRGAPIAGATVVLERDPARTTTSGADGSFAFDGLRAQRYRVVAWKDDDFVDGVDVLGGSPREPLVLRMKVGTTIDVAVTDGDTGKAIPHAHVRVDELRTVDADAAGIAHVRGLGPFFHYVEIAADGWAPATTSMMLQAEAGGARTIPVALAHGAALSGTVVDPSGRPVAGATVSVRGSDADVRAKTDAQGRWRVPAIGGGEHVVIAMSDRLGDSGGVEIVVEPGHDRGDLVLQLAQGHDLAGQVVDAAGAPVADAEAFAVADGAGVASAAADRDGRFVLHGLPAGAYDVFATSDTRASQLVHVDDVTVARELRLPIATAMISGTVVDRAGAPLAGARVDTSLADTRSWIGRSTVLTDSHGSFEAGPFPGTRYELAADWPDVGSENMYLDRRRVGAEVGQRDVTIDLAPGGTITGRVVHDGTPFPHFAVGIDDKGFSFHTSTLFDSADGRFTRAHVPAGTWRVAVVGEGVPLHILTNVRIDDGQTVDLGTIDLPSSRHVHGRVLDDAGAPVAGASVFTGSVVIPSRFDHDEDPIVAALYGNRRATTGADGRFDVALVGELHDRPEKIVATGPGHTRTHVAPIPDGDAELELRLGKGATIAGVVHGADAGTGVMAHSPAGDGWAFTDDSGHFHIDGLEPGGYRVEAQLMDAMQSTPSVSVEVAAGATANVELAFRPGVTLVVRGAAGEPGDCWLSLTPTAGGGLEPFAREVCVGEARIAHVPPDTYRLCRKNGIQTFCMTITVTAAPDPQTIELIH